MKNLTKKELKKIAQAALKNEYGFAPSCTDIQLLEAAGNGARMLFHVGSAVYEFDSHIVMCGDTETVWTGKGTIEKKDYEWTPAPEKKYRLVDYYEDYGVVGEYAYYEELEEAYKEWERDTDGECDLQGQKLENGVWVNIKVYTEV